MAWTPMQMCSSMRCFGIRGSYRVIRSCRCSASLTRHLILSNLIHACWQQASILSPVLIASIECSPTHGAPSRALTCTYEVHTGLYI